MSRDFDEASDDAIFSHFAFGLAPLPPYATMKRFLMAFDAAFLMHALAQLAKIPHAFDIIAICAGLQQPHAHAKSS